MDPLKVGEHLDAGDRVQVSSGNEVIRYGDKAMFESEPVDDDALAAPKVHLLSATPDPLGSLAAACMIYEGKVVRNLAEVTDDQRRFYLDDVMKTTLKAPLEDIDFHFMVEGLTRASWDQMVRQRTANFGGESLRFAVKLPLTTVVRAGPGINNPGKKTVWNQCVKDIEQAYTYLIGAGVPAEDARGLLPMNVLVRGHWKTNLRNLMTEIGKRTCTQAQFEWRQIIASMREAIYDYPGHVVSVSELDAGFDIVDTAWQFRLIAEQQSIWQPICFTTGQCMFKANADRGCTIRERVDRGAFDEIRTEEWAADPTAAWLR
jgi:flavin-dependent thymidylate synthase